MHLRTNTEHVHKLGSLYLYAMLYYWWALVRLIYVESDIKVVNTVVHLHPYFNN